MSPLCTLEKSPARARPTACSLASLISLPVTCAGAVCSERPFVAEMGRFSPFAGLQRSAGVVMGGR